MKKSLKQTLIGFILEQEKKRKKNISILELLEFLRKLSPDEIKKWVKKLKNHEKNL